MQNSFLDLLNIMFAKGNLAYILKVHMLKKVTNIFWAMRDLFSIFMGQRIDCRRAEIWWQGVLVDYWVWSATAAGDWLVVHENLQI